METSTSGSGSGCSGTGGGPPQCFVIVFNVAKRHNIGTLLRSCTAFNVKEVCLVGSNTFSAFGAQGTAEYVAMRHFPHLEACCQYLREVEGKRITGCSIMGVEIMDEAQPVHAHPFKGNTAFMLGNEGMGLSQRQIDACDSFVYIPQYGPGTASLNVTVAASIVLQNFAAWAGYRERERNGTKFVVDERPPRTRAKGIIRGGTADELHAEREARRLEIAAELDNTHYELFE